jgi:hypothetical protein
VQDYKAYGAHVLGITRRHEGVFSEISEFLAKLLNGAEEVSMPLPGMSLDFYSPDEGTAITALCQRGGGQNHRRCRARVRSNKTRVIGPEFPPPNAPSCQARSWLGGLRTRPPSPATAVAKSASCGASSKRARSADRSTGVLIRALTSDLRSLCRIFTNAYSPARSGEPPQWCSRVVGHASKAPRLGLYRQEPSSYLSRSRRGHLWPNCRVGDAKPRRPQSPNLEDLEGDAQDRPESVLHVSGRRAVRNGRPDPGGVSPLR